MRYTVLAALFAAFCTGPLLAQTGDCTNPTPIAGSGNWQWFPSVGWNSGFFSGPNCDVHARDEFYHQWTADVSGDYLFWGGERGGNGTNIIAIAAGLGCNAQCVVSHANMDNSWSSLYYGPAHVLIPNIQAGETFVIRLGVNPSAHPDFVNLGPQRNQWVVFGLKAKGGRPRRARPWTANAACKTPRLLEAGLSHPAT